MLYKLMQIRKVLVGLGPFWKTTKVPNPKQKWQYLGHDLLMSFDIDQILWILPVIYILRPQVEKIWTCTALKSFPLKYPLRVWGSVECNSPSYVYIKVKWTLHT